MPLHPSQYSGFSNLKKVSKMKETLTKANFWDAIEKVYPEQFKHFSNWVDEYKDRVNWNQIFLWKVGQEMPKIHHMPTAMQFGIFCQYTLEHENSKHNVNLIDYDSLETLDDFESLIIGWFKRNYNGKND